MLRATDEKQKVRKEVIPLPAQPARHQHSSSFFFLSRLCVAAAAAVRFPFSSAVAIVDPDRVPGLGQVLLSVSFFVLFIQIFVLFTTLT